jgi:hypothetical protein
MIVLSVFASLREKNAREGAESQSYLHKNYSAIMYKNFFIVIIILIGIHISSAQEKTIPIENINYEQIGDDKVLVMYDLLGSSDNDYEVTVYLTKTDNKEFKIKLKNLTGDVGEGKFAGTKKKIIWNVIKDYNDGIIKDEMLEDLSDGKIVFNITVNIIESRNSNLIYYIGGAAAVLVGGTAALLLLNKKEESKPNVENTFPKPPGTP